MSAIFTCEKCGKSYNIKSTQKRIFCSCGSANLNPNTSDPAADLPCVYRGAIVGDLNCGCAGKPKVYACEKHGKCALRKLKPGDFGVMYCLGCSDRTLYRVGRVGMVLSVFNQIGGVETWATSLLQRLREPTGIATSAEPQGSSQLPVFGGKDAIEDILKTSNNILAWGATDDLEEAMKQYPGARVIAVHHGSLQSEWGNSVFERQLQFCHCGVAVNKDVANRFGVRHMRNLVDPARSLPSSSRMQWPRRTRDLERYVLWSHRPSSEKRPELAQAIAEQLPNNWKMLFTGTSAVKSTEKLLNIGRIAHPGDYLDKCEVFLSTADQEAFGYSIAEAVLAQRPVVSAPAGLALDGWATEVVETDDPQHWVAAILRAAEASQQEIQKKFEDFAAEYAIAKVLREWEELFA
jgi:hypothetical protein